jgi:two-component system NarL family sensor kinase
LIQIATYVTSMAIERQRSDQVLRDFHQRVVEAQETERRRVSRELHDSVSQLLASIRFRIQSAIEIPAVDLNERHGEKLQLKLLVDHAMREVRRISRNLRPSELDDLGLESAIGNLAREFDQRMRIELAIHLSNLPKRFPPEIELALYRIIQESLRNVELHSGATRAEVRLTRTRNSVLLKIKDNGHGGIDTSARSKRRAESGIGLANIRERAAMVGGTFTIESNHLTGTEIAVRIPLEALGKSAKD